MDWNSMMRIALAAGVAAYANGVAAAAAGEVTLRLTPERQSLAGSDDVIVKASITNTGPATLYLLKWQTPLGAGEAPLFEVTRDGLPVRYLGMQVKRPAPGPADYVALKPGASLSRRIELSALYDMGITGAYSVRWRDGATQLFNRPGVVRATALPAPDAASIWIAGRQPRGALDTLPAAPDGPGGLSFSRCSNAQQASIADAVQVAQAMAQDADGYLQAATLAARYTSWFGAVDAARSATVARHFKAIKDAFAGKPVTVDCGCNESWYAYVYPNQPYRIHVCKAFWSAPMSGTDSKGGTLVHEMSHFTVVTGTDDIVYGQSAAGQLAASDPGKAIDNADSHEYFGENTPHLELH